MIKKIFALLAGILVLQTSTYLYAQNGWDQKKLNTASNATYLNDFEKEVIFELNKARSNPAKYAEKYLENLTGAYDGKILKIPGETPIKTQEGKKALLECIRSMKKAAPLPLLYPSKGLSQAAELLVKDQQKTGKVGHIGKDRSNPQDRIEKYGNWLDKFSENLTYGKNSPQRVVISLLVDDGVPGRGHRKSLLSNSYKAVGVATGNHPNYKEMCVVEMTGGFQDK
jgi:uncharacterized protein YkwD